jgi:hypothetical protein
MSGSECSRESAWHGVILSANPAKTPDFFVELKRHFFRYFRQHEKGGGPELKPGLREVAAT